MRTNACAGCERGAGLVVAALCGLVAVALRVRRPEREVVPQELHDQRRVLVRVLVQRVQLRDRVVKRLQHHGPTSNIALTHVHNVNFI